MVSIPRGSAPPGLPVHCSEWVPGTALGSSSVLTLSPKCYLLSFLIAFKLNLLSGPRPHGPQAKGHLEIPLLSPSQGSVQEHLCFPQMYKMSARSPLLFLEVLGFPCPMAMLSFPSPPLPCCSSHSSTLWPFRGSSSASTALATVWIRNPRELWSPLVSWSSWDQNSFSATAAIGKSSWHIPVVSLECFWISCFW